MMLLLRGRVVYFGDRGALPDLALIPRILSITQSFKCRALDLQELVRSRKSPPMRAWCMEYAVAPQVLLTDDCSAGHEAIEYFNGLPLKANGMQPAEPLQEGNNEAEWIVDLTTRADREGRRACTAYPYPSSPSEQD